jgi:hypothetical protein
MSEIIKLELNKSEWRKVKWLSCLLCLIKTKDFARSRACQPTQHSTHKKAQCFPNVSNVQRMTIILVAPVATLLIWKPLCILMAHSVTTWQCESVDYGLVVRSCPAYFPTPSENYSKVLYFVHFLVVEYAVRGFTSSCIVSLIPSNIKM